MPIQGVGIGKLNGGKTMLKFEHVNELLEYEPETGVLRWIKSPNKRVAIGSKAGSISSFGYIKLKIDKKEYFAHRIAWLLYYKEWPSGQIDHIDNNRKNNAISNLRDCTASQNQRNQKRRKSNSTGIKGVYWDANLNKWKVQVRGDGRIQYGGHYKSIQAAELAAIELRNRLHGEYANHG